MTMAEEHMRDDVAVGRQQRLQFGLVGKADDIGIGDMHAHRIVVHEQPGLLPGGARLESTAESQA